MKNLTHKLGRFLTWKNGPAAVDCVVLLAPIIVVALTVMSSVGPSTGELSAQVCLPAAAN